MQHSKGVRLFRHRHTSKQSKLRRIQISFEHSLVDRLGSTSQRTPKLPNTIP
jgi:hypothetical protein